MGATAGVVAGAALAFVLFHLLLGDDYLMYRAGVCLPFAGLLAGWGLSDRL